MHHKNFPTVDSKKSFDQMEQDMLKFWEKHKIFEQSIASRDPKNEYTFYDGPPFATGMPHYGHFLASIIKDVVPRYFTMKGHRVERRFGWDCHGLPIENIVEGELDTKSKKDIEDKVGVEKFNELCRSKVQLYVDEWEKIITRLGRWVDFKNDYKTMDLDFMESVMWLFAELHKKGLIYEGRRISLYCPRCATPLSNFEIAMDNSYTTVTEPSNIYKYKVKNEENTFLLAWSTTPWNKLATPALAVNPTLTYVKAKVKSGMDGQEDQNTFIVAESLVEKVFAKYEYEIVDKCSGKELEKVEFEIHYDFYLSENNGEKVGIVVADEFVSDEDGTGIVTLAVYGEDDERVMKEHNIQMVEHVDDSGKVKAFAGEMWAGRDIQDVNRDVNRDLKNRGLMFSETQHTHNVAQCWRCETRLFHKPQRAYFLDVQKIKDDMLANNENINWEPTHLKTGRFRKGLETAPDWNLSRNRFWGSPIPIWKCENEDCDHQDVVGSIQELEDLSGEKVEDLHKHFVDKYTWKCKKCGGTMKRTEEVLDCWFESGAMPYAQKHFPFENEDRFENTFPGDFIAEYIAQTRGWFYTLHVLSTALMNSHSFKNVICTGTILAEDGNKMSKSKKNYPDPTIMFEKYGSDAMRYYLMASSVMKGENFNFSEKGVEEVLKTIILPIRNAYQFFQLYANIDNWTPTKFSFARHGEADHNLNGIYSGNIENQHHLTEKGKKQAQAAAEKIGDFDALYYSPFVRTTETAQEILKKAGNGVEGIKDERLREVNFGDLEGKKYIPIIERLKHETGEHLNDIQDRMREAVREYGEKHRGKHVVVVSHGGPIRYVMAARHNIWTEEESLMVPSFKPGGWHFMFALPKTENELDQWILSETQVLLKEFQEKMDGYQLSDAIKNVPKFIDNLNNWYLRRSRKRFWNSGMNEDKISGYETLHYVLLTLSKILAPFCPFFAEKLFQDLVKDDSQSVHLEFLSFPKAEWINETLNEKIKISREIVRLSAAIRARKKIKLRQPLAKLQFFVSGFDVSMLDLDILKQEANVKEIEILEADELQKIAKKIVKVDARKVGRKFGKKMQELIKEGKSGNFKTLENGQIEIAGELLESDEYEAQFLCDEKFDAENFGNLVVLLETEISETLKIEGAGRELIRAIQEKRKNDGFEISDRINITFKTDSELLKSAFTQFQKQISAEVLALSIAEGSTDNAETIKIDGESIALEITKNS